MMKSRDDDRWERWLSLGELVVKPKLHGLPQSLSDGR